MTNFQPSSNSCICWKIARAEEFTNQNWFCGPVKTIALNWLWFPLTLTLLKPEKSDVWQLYGFEPLCGAKETVFEQLYSFQICHIRMQHTPLQVKLPGSEVLLSPSSRHGLACEIIQQCLTNLNSWAKPSSHATLCPAWALTQPCWRPWLKAHPQMSTDSLQHVTLLDLLPALHVWLISHVLLKIPLFPL